MDLKFDISFKILNNDNSVRNKILRGSYDLENKTVEQKFKGCYTLPEKWNIGLIVGNSGSGKTSIANQALGLTSLPTWNDEAIIDNFPEKISMESITEILGNVGFNSIPYWLKPFSVLSNGEKQRVNLARMFSENSLVVFDEFSSLVDRVVAKSMSNSVQKLFRKYDKQFVAVTCHKDLQEWLQPDWVYDTDTHVFFCPKKSEKNKYDSTLNESIQKSGNIIKSIII